eukprot:417342_1
MSESHKQQKNKPRRIRHVPQVPNPFNIKITRYRQHDTLQGYIHCGVFSDNNTPVVIKETIKELVENNLSRSNHRIHENFHEEKRILLYLSNQTDIDSGICAILNSMVWEDSKSYYYAMQHCKAGLFDYIKSEFENQKSGTMAKIISNPNLNTKPFMPWITKIQNIFRQICRAVGYCHSKGIAHLDLSLENTLIFNKNQCLVKLIDFGLSHDINKHSNSWISNKRVGKLSYMSPEVYNKQNYDCRSVDVWCIGVMLFMMLIGTPPYSRPIVHKDSSLSLLIAGKIEKLLNHFGRIWMISDDAMDLLIKIFKFEGDRISMNDVLCHPFVGLNVNCNGNLNVKICPYIRRTVSVLKDYNDELLNEYNIIP